MPIEFNPDVEFFTDGDKDYELWNLLTQTRYIIFRVRENELRKYGLRLSDGLE